MSSRPRPEAPSGLLDLFFCVVGRRGRNIAVSWYGTPTNQRELEGRILVNILSHQLDEKGI